MSYKEYNQDQPFLLPLSLHDFLPEGRLARVINDVVNELNLEELYERYSDLGCAAENFQYKVEAEFLIMCIAHNLKKIAKYLRGSKNPDLCTIGI